MSTRAEGSHLLRNSLFGLLALIVLLMLSVVYILAVPSASKTVIEFALSALTNREFHIDGDFDLKIGDTIVIRAENVRWDNASWGATPYMMDIGSIQGSIDTNSLFNPPVVIQTAVGENASLDFEWNEEGVSNWYFFADEQDDSDDDEPLEPIPLLLARAAVNNVAITFRDPLLTSPVELKVIEASQQQDNVNRLVVSGRYELGGRESDIQGRIGPFPELIVAGNVNIAARTRGELQSLRVIAEIDNLLTLTGAKFDFKWRAPDAVPALQVLNLPGNATKGRIDVSAQLTTVDGDVRGFIDGDIGEFQVDGTFDAPEFDIYKDLHLNFSSSGPSAGAAGLVIGIEGLPSEPYTVNITADSREDGLHVSEFYARTAGAEMNATALLPQAPAFINADAEISIKGNNLLKFQGMTDLLTFIEEPFSGDFVLKGNGKGTPDSLTGKIKLAKMTGNITAQLGENEDLVISTIDYDLVFPDAQKVGYMVGTYLTKTGILTAKGSAKIVEEGIQIEDLVLLLANDEQVINGLIPRDPKKEVDLQITFSGPDFNEYSSYYLPFGIGPPLPYKINSTVVIGTDGIYRSKGGGKVGSANFNSYWEIDLTSEKTIDIKGNFKADGDNIAEWLQEYVAQTQKKRPFEISSDLSIDDDGISAQNMLLELRNATIAGNITSRWPENPEIIAFELDIKGKNMAADLPEFAGFKAAAVPFKLSARGEFDEGLVNLEFLNAQIGSVTAKIQGGARLPPAVSTEQLNINIAGERLGDLGSIEGWELKDVPFLVSAVVNTKGNVIDIDDLNVVFGPSDLTGNVDLTFNETPYFELDLFSKNIDIGAALTREQDDFVDSMLDDPSGSTDGRLIPDLEIPAELLGSYEGKLKFNVDRISRNDEKFSSMQIEASLDNGSLAIPVFYAQTTLGDIKSSLKLSPANNNYELVMDMNASNVRLVSAKASATDRVQYQGHNIDYRLVGKGNNLREMASNFDGYLWIRGGEREIENIRYSSLFGDAFTQIGQIVNPYYEKDPYTLIECELYFFEAEEGVMSTAPTAIIKTEKVNVVSAGTIDLSDERLRLGIETIPRKGVGISAGDLFTPFVRIGGTMEEPKAAVDPKGSLIEGGAAYLTFGLSIVGKSLYQRWIKADKSCAELTEIARNARLKRDPDHVPPD